MVLKECGELPGLRLGVFNNRELELFELDLLMGQAFAFAFASACAVRRVCGTPISATGKQANKPDYVPKLSPALRFVLFKPLRVEMASYNSEAPVLDTYHAVVAAYSDFLTVAIHTILYERNIYPQASFIKARKYNYPVRQSRHPKVCRWIMDAVSAVEAEMLKVGGFLV